MIRILSPEKDNINEFIKMGNQIYSLVYLKQNYNINIPHFVCLPYDTCYSFISDLRQNIMFAMSEFRNDKITAIDAANYIQSIINDVIFSQQVLEELSMNINSYLHVSENDIFEVKTVLFWEATGISQSYYENEKMICDNVSYEDIAQAILCALGSMYSEEVLTKLKDSNFQLDFPKNNIIIQRKLRTEIYGTVTPYNEKENILNETVISANVGEYIEHDEEMQEIYHYNGSDGQYYNEKLCEYELLSKKDILILMKQINLLNNVVSQGNPISLEYTMENDLIYVTSTTTLTNNQSQNNSLLYSKYLEDYEKGVMTELSKTYWEYINKKILYSTFKNKLKIEEVYSQNINITSNAFVFRNESAYVKPENASPFVRMLPYSTSAFPCWLIDTNLANPRYKILEPNLPTTWAKIQKQNEKEVLNIIKNKNNILAQLNQLDNLFKQTYNNEMSPNDLLNLKKSYACYIKKTLKDALLKAKINEKSIDILFEETLYNQENEIDAYVNKLFTFPMQNDIFKRVLMQIENKEQYDMFINQNPNDQFVIMLNQFMSEYGFMCPYSIKFEELSFEENPKALVDMILEKCEKPNKSSILFNDLSLSKTLNKKGYVENFELLRSIGQLLTSINFAKRKFFSYIRYIFLDIGNELKENHFIEDKLDIVYLCYNDITHPSNELKNKVEMNKKKYEDVCHIPQFKQIIFNYPNGGNNNGL